LAVSSALPLIWLALPPPKRHERQREGQQYQ
jgi:hypothetical protein